MKAFRVLLIVFCVALFATKSYGFIRQQVFLKPAEKTLISFNKQIKYVDATSGSNLIFDISNYPGKGVLKITSNEVFSSASFHVIFDDGFIATFTAYADPTAPLTYEFEVEGSQISAKSKSHKRWSFFVSSQVPNTVKPLLVGLNRLKDAQRVYIRWPQSLPPLIGATVTRTLDLGDKLFLEVKVQNFSFRPMQVDVRQFASYLTECASIVSMDSSGKAEIEPKSYVLLYLVNRKS